MICSFLIYFKKFGSFFIFYLNVHNKFLWQILYRVKIKGEQMSP